jgi:hypothetical protein
VNLVEGMKERRGGGGSRRFSRVFKHFDFVLSV